MKTIFRILTVVLALALAAPAASAQQSKKQLKKELNSKVVKENKKAAKKLAKEGWKVMPGKLPLQRQLQDTQYAELDTNDEGGKLFFVGMHQAIGGSYSAAKQIADTRARGELAQAVYSQVKQSIEDKVAHLDLGDGDIETIEEFVSASKSIVSAQLKEVVPVLEMYRELDNNRYEVRVAVKMDAEQAMKLAKSGLKNELMIKSQKLAESLDVILPY